MERIEPRGGLIFNIYLPAFSRRGLDKAVSGRFPEVPEAKKPPLKRIPIGL